MDLFNTYISKSFDETLTSISKLGSIQLYLIILGTSYFLQEELFFKFLLFGIILMTGIAIPIRYFLFKERPKREKYSNCIEKIKASSFPSMHSARFSFLIISSYIIFKNFELTAFLSSIYFIICFHRIYSKKHDIFDIFGGIILSLSIAIFLSNIKGF